VNSAEPNVKSNWEQIKQILHDAVELPPAERAGFVANAAAGDAEIIAEVESLLASFDEAEEFLEESPMQLTGMGNSLEGRWIGEYHVGKLIAEGGMGSVYHAAKEIDGFPMPVALKVIRFAASNDYVQRRFRMERQILARLAHENILRLLDGGVTADGQPYIVTEYLDAQHLEQWLDEAKPSLEERLRLFAKICDGVAHAHRNLIVHGDIKPSNILVTREGTPKLVDFGIARLIKSEEEAAAGGQITHTMAPAFTPWWASPEQLRGEPLGIESDCYELGRILFFLLTRKPPFDLHGLSTQQILELLQKCPPPKPSLIAGDTRLEGDLDNITRKALEYDRHLRYRGADALADDILRHLEFRPISARPYTWTYRFHKFIRRNKGLVAVAATATIALVTTVSIALYQANESRRYYESSRLHYEQLRSLSNSLLFESDEALATIPGATPIRARLIRRALGYLDELARKDNSDPAIKEELVSAYLKIGDIQGRPGSPNLGQTGEALLSYKKAEALCEVIRRAAVNAASFREASDQLATVYARVSAALRATGDTEQALSYERKALGIRQALYEADPANPTRIRALASSLTTLSGSLSQKGDWTAVLQMRQESLRMFEELAAQSPDNTEDRRSLALALARMGSIELHEGKLTESHDHYKRALDIDYGLHLREPANMRFQINTGWAHTNYGIILHRMGKPREALDHFVRGRAYYVDVARVDASEVRSRTLLQANKVHHARALLTLKRLRDAKSLADSALLERKQLANLNRENAGALGEVGETHTLIGQILAAMGQRENALAEFDTAYRIFSGLTASDRANAAIQEDIETVRKEFAQLNAAPPNGR
jgi:eukaryotic-like serine/threonine-protein kinase